MEMTNVEKHFTDIIEQDRIMIEAYLSKAFAVDIRYADLQEAMEY